ncbi:hypothetical protein [Streptomyces sp. RLB3-6]|uniref:hypothetical protein n=1 Tax=Streptomyces sp. RLB3-6 TaxID=2594457 RepID=UPI0011622DE1|nr:hypothetical protein [Streptomyces sp. RLB3-6]QDN87403.1 hypothetical protein FNV61_18765 [Streptomyces sp. RLB3-6]
MASARRAARAGLNRPEAEDDGVPDWIWGREFTPRRWAADHGGTFEGRYDAAMEWRRQRDAWLHERGLVVQGMADVSYEDFKRIEREEPHRVLRRPDA